MTGTNIGYYERRIKLYELEKTAYENRAEYEMKMLDIYHSLWYDYLTELRYNHNHDPSNGRFCSGGGSENIISGLTNDTKSGIINSGSEVMLRVSTGGHRNEMPLNTEQIENCIDYIRMLGFEGDVAYSDYSYTAFVGSIEGEKYCRMIIGTDVFPSDMPTSANEKLSYKAAIAHEVVGHYEAWKGGFEQNITALDEAQASIRAARFAKGLTTSDRIGLIQDAVSRLRNEGIPLKEAKKHIRISER